MPSQLVVGRRVFAGGVVAALVLAAAPRLGERGMAPQTAAIAALKVIGLAQVSYWALSRGAEYGSFACLTSGSCLPGISDEPLLDRDLIWRTAQRGYLVTLRADAQSFVATAIPASSQTKAPLPSFCLDVRQTIFVTPDGSPPASTAGRCASGTPLQ